MQFSSNIFLTGVFCLFSPVCLYTAIQDTSYKQTEKLGVPLQILFGNYQKITLNKKYHATTVPNRNWHLGIPASQNLSPFSEIIM